MSEVLRPQDKHWPKRLNDLGKQTPKQIYYSGKWDNSLFDKCACVVGSRRMTQYGQRVIEKMVPKLVNDGWTIVSGMMYGVDQAAHRICMECGGRTIGVLGWGLRFEIENRDKEVQRDIVKSGGLLISEWEEQAGTLWTFPRRDRIMAALACDLYVIEAASRSGALITADWALKLNRSVWAVPGPVTSSVSIGTNRLIAEGKAKIWTPEIDHRQSKVDDRYTKNTEIYTLLQNETLSVDEISRKLGKPVNELGAILTEMVLKGEVEEREGKYYLKDR